MTPRIGCLNRKPPSKHDLAKILPDFETGQQVAEYRTQRIALLRKHKPKGVALADKLDACGHDDGRCRSPACPVCCRAFRRWVYGQAARLLQPCDASDLWAMTLIMPKRRARVGKLTKLDPRAAVKSVRTQLQRADLSGLIAIGGVDLSLEVDQRLGQGPEWQLHLHIIGAGCDRQAVRQALSPYYPSTAAVERPIKVQSVRNRPKQLSYCFKFHHQRRVQRDGLKPIYRPLHSDESIEDLLFLDRYQFSDFLFLKGVRRDGSQLKFV